MKKLFITIGLLGSLTACEKTELKPVTISSTAEETASPPLKIEGNTRSWNYCSVYNRWGSKMGSGRKCSGKGDECGRKANCELTHSSFSDDDIVLENMTYKEFSEMWNTEDGRETLLQKGFYETDY